MKSLSICHAGGDRARATELACFMELNFRFEVAFDEVRTAPGDDILCATERALAANFAIVLLSPDSLPVPLRREQWERAFVKAPAEYETPIAFALLRECAFPELLRRGANFFPAEDNFLGCMRRLKRWILAIERGETASAVKRAPADSDTPHAAWREVVDRPGTLDHAAAELAALLVHECRDDFEKVLRIRAAGRPLEVILGDLGRALGLHLRGPLEEDRRAIEWSVMNRRLLLVFDNPADELKDCLRFGGKCSVVMTTVEPAAAAEVRPEQVTIENIGNAIEYALRLMPGDRDAGGKLARRIVSVLSDHGNFAEAALLLDAVLRQVPQRAEWARRELDWIHEQWGDSVEVPMPPLPNAMQMDLFGDSGRMGDETWMAA